MKRVQKLKTGNEVSLTDFLTYVTKKSGTERISFVEALLLRDDYSPKKDYYRQVREGIISELKKGKISKLSLLAKAHHRQETRQKNFINIVEGLSQILQEKEFEWLNPPKKIIFLESLPIKINPEIGLKLDNKSFIVKLYFKKEIPSIEEINIGLQIMSESHLLTDCIPAIIDLPRGRLFYLENSNEELSALAAAEAASLLSLMNFFQRKAA